MVDRLERLQLTVEELADQLRRLEARVDEIEARPARGPADREAVPDETAVALPKVALPQGTLALVGRSLVVLAGAYLVRAVTDGQVLPASLGVFLGLAYAVFWQLLAGRDARAGRRESAAFHGLASSLIAYPLIWETTARFGLLSPRAAAAALVGFFTLALWVAWRGRLVVNATLATVLSLITAVALIVSTHDLLAGLATLLAIAAGLEWLAWRDRWRALRWPAAAVLDGIALLLAVVVTSPQGMPEGYVPVSAPAAAVALLALPVLYIVSLAVRTVRRGRPVTLFGAVQGSVALLLGLGGAWRVLGVHGLPTTVPGILAVVLGALCYATAFAFAERRTGMARNFYLYATAGGLLTLAGTSALGLGGGLALVWSGLGLVAALLGRRFDRMTLRLHSALYFVAAAVQAGMVAACARALVGRSAEPLSALTWGTALAAAAGYGVLATDPAAPRRGWARLPQFLLAFLVALAGARLLQLAAWVALGDTVATDAGVAATVATGALALVALGAAWGARKSTLPELGWLVYPLIVLGGLKLLLQDLPLGRPATLVLSLAIYGAVLILTPRLVKTREA